MTDQGRRRFLMTAGIGLGATAGVAAVAACDTGRPTVPVDVRARTVLADLSSSRSAKQNTEAIGAATDEAGRSGADVTIPGGQFDTEGFYVPTEGGLTIRGVGRGLTKLRNVSSNPSIAAHGRAGGPYCTAWSLSDLSVSAADRAVAGAGLDVLLATRFSVSDVEIHGHATGVRHQSSWACDYASVTVQGGGVGWLFPTSQFTPSAPVSLRAADSIENETAVRIDDALESVVWNGGDFSGCGTGLRITGRATRTILMTGINFERIREEDVIIGEGEAGPSGISLHACRFLRTERGALSVRFLRGDGVSLLGCRWDNYAVALDQAGTAGSVLWVGNSTARVDRTLNRTEGVVDSAGFVAAAGADLTHVSMTGTSLFHSVSGREGVQTKMVSGPGRVTVADSDFKVLPAPGWTCLVENTTDGTLRHAVRGARGWAVSEPYRAG